MQEGRWEEAEVEAEVQPEVRPFLAEEPKILCFGPRRIRSRSSLSQGKNDD